MAIADASAYAPITVETVIKSEPEEIETLHELDSLQLASLVSGSKWQGLLECLNVNMYDRLFVHCGRVSSSITIMADNLSNILKESQMANNNYDKGDSDHIDVSIDIWKIIVLYLTTKEQCYFALAKCQSDKHYSFPLLLGYIEGIIIVLFIIFNIIYDINGHYLSPSSIDCIRNLAIIYCVCIFLHICGILTVCYVNLNSTMVRKFKAMKSQLYDTRNHIRTPSVAVLVDSALALKDSNRNSAKIMENSSKDNYVFDTVHNHSTSSVKKTQKSIINDTDYILNTFNFPAQSQVLVKHNFCYFWELYIPLQQWSNVLQITIFDSLYENESVHFKLCLVFKIVFFKYIVALSMLFFPIKMLNNLKFTISETIELMIAYCVVFSLIACYSWILIERWNWGVDNSHSVFFQQFKKKSTIVIIVVMVCSLSFFYHHGALYFWLFFTIHCYFLMLQTLWQSLSKRLHFGGTNRNGNGNNNGQNRDKFAYLNLSFDPKQRGRLYQFIRCMCSFWYFPQPIQFRHEKNAMSHTVVVHPY